MPALKDEMIFQADGMIPVDPALGLRERAEAFVRARQWSTPSIFYGDQPEPETSEPRWSATFGLGLDHIAKSEADWFADVAAIVEFLQPIASETHSEFILEFRLSSRLWYSQTLAHITDNPAPGVDLAGIRHMLDQLTRQQQSPRQSWWQRLTQRSRRTF